MAESLRSKSVKGTIWTAIQKFSVMGISFLSNIILARMLSPDNFGCIAMLAIFLVISDTFMDSGLGSALIQKKHLTNTDSSTVFIFNLCVAITLYITLFFCAPLISDFYKTPILTPLLRFQSIILIIYSFNIVQRNLLRKEMKFSTLAKANILASIISIIVAVGMAYAGCKVWALVGQQIAFASVSTIMLWKQSDWRPHAEFSKQSFKELFNFGSFLFISNLINNIGNNIQSLIIGKAFNPNTLGYYSQAKKLEEVSSTTISTIIDQVSFPAMASKQDDPKAIIFIMKKFTKIIAFFSMPLMILLSILGEPIIMIFYGEKWIQSIPYFKVLCFAGIFICLQTVSYYAIISIGKTKLVFYWTIIKRILALAALLIGLSWGMNGVLAAVVFGTFIILFCNDLLVHLYLKYSLWNQFKDLLPVILITAIASAITLASSIALPQNIYIKGLCQLTIFVACYLIISKVCRLEALRDVKQIVQETLNKRKRND